MGGMCHWLSLLTGSAPHGKRRMSACLPQSVSVLRHHRTVADGKREGMSPRLPGSAWLPPGLALGWLAALAAFVHGVTDLVVTWVATVSLALILARWRSPRPGHPAETGNIQTKALDPASPSPPSLAAPATSPSAPRRTHRLAPEMTTSALVSPPEPPSPTESAVMPGMRVLTATEVASVLRVDIDAIIRAIRNGELPGNRIGEDWRVEAGALENWLQGAYGRLAQERSDGDEASAPAKGVSP